MANFIPLDIQSPGATSAALGEDLRYLLQMGDAAMAETIDTIAVVQDGGLKAAEPAAVRTFVGLDLVEADLAAIDARVETVEMNQVTGVKTFETWTALSLTTGALGDGADVLPTDTGTHTDPVVGGTVANAGRYVWSASPAGWKWVTAEAYSGLDARVDALENAVSYEPEYTYKAVGGAEIASTDDVVGVLFQDDAGYAIGAVLDDGTVALERFRSGGAEVNGDEANNGFAITDEADNVLLGAKKDGLTFGNLDIFVGEGNYDLAVTDESDNPVFAVKGSQLVLPSGSIDSQDVVDAGNRAYAAVYLDRGVDGVQQPVADYNSIIGYGQSLMMGQEAWPALTTVQQFGNLMLGGDVRPAALDGSSYTQVSPSGLQPLTAKVRSNADASVLSDVAVAALSAGDQARGESPVVSMANMASWLIGRRTLAQPKPFVVTCPAVSGTTIEQLSKVNGQDATNRYNRYLSSVSQIQSIAAGASDSHVISALCWMQGEYDYAETWGSGNATKALYKTALAQMRSDMVADCKAATGQTEDPIFITYQTGASYTVDADGDGVAGLHIGMAQLEFALENPTKVIMAGPIYPVTDKNGHLDSNGSRWFGQMMAKAYVRAVIDGKRFRPLSPIRIEAVGATRIRAHFFVPVPPLQFALPYVANTATDFAAKGFRVTDASGAAAISSVSIIADTIVEIGLGREIDVESASLWYASKTTFNGAGCLRDSDDALSRDRYVYLAGSGMYASANIPALVDNPYPLNNWCVAFHLPIGHEE
jgi:Carbohydrate esterase, sialic acid-specific acetylesterase